MNQAYKGNFKSQKLAINSNTPNALNALGF